MVQPNTNRRILPRRSTRFQRHRHNMQMPDLAVNTSTTIQPVQSDTPPPSQSSPIRPTVSPITPPRGASRSTRSLESSPTGNKAPPSRQTYTHSQPDQEVIAQPSPVPIDFENNPDVLAVKSAIAILQIQARNTKNDIQTIQQIKKRALEDPEAFVQAAATGEITSTTGTLFAPSLDNENEDVEVALQETEQREAWPKLPTPQDVVRCPPVNWHQYAVDGEPLNRMHADQQARPSEGQPQIIQPDGQLISAGEGRRRSHASIAAPYQPGKDKLQKTIVKRGGKR